MLRLYDFDVLALLLQPKSEILTILTMTVGITNITSLASTSCASGTEPTVVTDRDTDVSVSGLLH